MKKILETKTCKINYLDSLEPLARETISLLDKKMIEYQNFFEMKFVEQFVVNYFDNIEDFRNYIYEIRGEKESLPEYAQGTYDNGMINVYINPAIQLNKIYTAPHELFHILYMKYVLNNDYSKRIVWYDEGMAQFISGQKDYLNNEDEFKKFYIRVKEETKNIPIINEIDHGKSFRNENYKGYDLSYLAVRYLSETMSKTEFKKLMSNFKKIKTIGETIIQDMFNYYDEKLNSKLNKL